MVAIAEKPLPKNSLLRHTTQPLPLFSPDILPSPDFVGQISKGLVKAADYYMAQPYGKVKGSLSDRFQSVIQGMESQGVHIGNHRDAKKQEAYQKICRTHLPFTPAPLITEAGLILSLGRRFSLGTAQARNEGHVSYTLTERDISLAVRTDRGPHTRRSVTYKVSQGRYDEHWNKVELKIEEQNGKEHSSTTINTNAGKGEWEFTTRSNGKIVDKQRRTPTIEDARNIYTADQQMRRIISA